MTEREKERQRAARKKPLTAPEQKFITHYIKTGKLGEAAKVAGYVRGTNQSYDSLGRGILERPNVQAEIKKIMRKLEKESIASAEEVMNFFTAVMRGEVPDQFGLDASLADRTKAAQELAKRTVDIENRERGKADSLVEIKLNWRR